MENLRYLIVGCGRSGTGYLAKAISNSGKYCGHEEKYTLSGMNELSQNIYESSWFSVPFLGELPKNVKILHIVRDPRKVIGSFYRIGLFADEIWQHLTFGRPASFINRSIFKPRSAIKRMKLVNQHRIYFKEHTDIFSCDGEISRLQRYWLEWNKKIQWYGENSGNNYMRLNIEDVEEKVDALQDFLNTDLELQKATDRNEKKNYLRGDIGEYEFFSELTSLSKSYGYHF
jgi:hypothetical protein